MALIIIHEMGVVVECYPSSGTSCMQARMEVCVVLYLGIPGTSALVLCAGRWMKGVTTIVHNSCWLRIDPCGQHVMMFDGRYENNG